MGVEIVYVVIVQVVLWWVLSESVLGLKVVRKIQVLVSVRFFMSMIWFSVLMKLRVFFGQLGMVMVLVWNMKLVKMQNVVSVQLIRCVWKLMRMRRFEMSLKMLVRQVSVEVVGRFVFVIILVVLVGLVSLLKLDRMNMKESRMWVINRM